MCYWCEIRKSCVSCGKPLQAEKPTSSCMVDSAVLFDHEARIIAAILSEKPMTLCLGRRHGVATAKRWANQIKREINIIQNGKDECLP